MKHIIYEGSFLSRAGVTWTVNILQEGAPASHEELTFEAEEALVIEWGKTQKYEVIQGSSATIRIDSPGDRTYQGLYSVAPGDIRMDVYRNEELYWSGTLDPEFYEEPYERLKNYPVSLTFSDFGILDRKKYNLHGYVTLEEILDTCIYESDVNYIDIPTHISTSLPGYNTMSLSDICVRSDNFYDEDGEALSLKEVLEGIFQPLGLRMIQRNGCIEIYDLNSLYGTNNVKSLVWCGDRSLMSVDKVYNNAKITWSTYAISGNMVNDHCYVHGVDRNVSALNYMDGVEHNGSLVFSYHYSPEITKWNDMKDYGFSLWTSSDGINAEIVNTNAKFYKIVPQYDGEESEGIALFWDSVFMQTGVTPEGDEYSAYGERDKGIPLSDLKGNLSTAGGVIFKTNKMEIPSIPDSESLRIRVAMNLLFDPRFNPFEPAANLTEEGRYIPDVSQKKFQDDYKDAANFLYVPVKILFKPYGERKTYCWTNQNIVATTHTSPITQIGETLGSWVEDNDSVWGYLCYYDPHNRKSNSGIGQGFAKNRPAINPHTQQLSTVVENTNEQLIPYPNMGGGKLWMEILSGGWIINEGDVDLSSTTTSNPAYIWGIGNADEINWILAQLPSIEIESNQQFDTSLSTDDVEYNSEINPDAKEGLELETICGTKAGGVPTARGAYFDGTEQITEFTRAGRTSQVEDLLIGTIYSQFAKRHTSLSGEVKLLNDNIAAYTEANQGNKKFMVCSDIQDVIEDTSDATFIELSPDEYSRKK